MKKFSTRLVLWHELHGRKNLPWQKKITPYKVWVSEIMLQQTQVVTAIPYFKKLISDKSKFLPITDPGMTRFFITLKLFYLNYLRLVIRHSLSRLLL